MRNLGRRLTAFVCAFVIMLSSFTVPVYAEEDANTVSFSKLASAASGFLSDAVAHKTWISGDASSYDSVLCSNNSLSSATLKPGNAGGMLGYPDESNCGGVVWDWLSSRTTVASVTYSYSSLIEIGGTGAGEGNNPMVIYALFGRFMTQLGLDSTGDKSSGMARSIAGWSLGLVYQLANLSNVIFKNITVVLEYINPFSFLSGMDPMNGFLGSSSSSDVPDGGDLPEDGAAGSVEGLDPVDLGETTKVLNYLRDKWVWSIVIPFFAIIMIVNLLLRKSKNKPLEIKKFLWRVFTVTCMVAILGGTYNTILGQLSKAYGTVSPATKAIMSTFFDFQSWVEDAHMSVPEGVNLKADKTGTPTDDTVLSARSISLALNQHSLNSVLGTTSWISEIGGVNEAINDSKNQTTVNWNQSMRDTDWDVTKESAEWIMDLLNRYGEKTFYRASDWEAYYKNAYLDYSDSNDENTAGQSLANIIQHTDDALDWKKIDENENTPGKQLITGDGSASFEVSGTSYQYNYSNNIWNTTTAYGAGGGSGYLGYLGSMYFAIFGGNDCLLSPLAIYNYLNTEFTDNGLVVFKPDLSTSDYSRSYHYSVSLVGDTSLSFFYYLNVLTLLGCMTALSFVYAFQVIFAAVRRTIQICIATPFATLGMLRYSAKLIYHTIMLILEIVVTMFLYAIVSDLLVSFMTIFEKIIINAVSTATPEDMMGGTGTSDGVVEPATRLFSVNSGTVLFSGMDSVPLSDTIFSSKSLELVTVLLSIVFYIILTVLLIRYRKVVIKGLDEMVGDWTKSFVPGAKPNDMNLPDSRVGASLRDLGNRSANAIGATVGAGIAANEAVKDSMANYAADGELDDANSETANQNAENNEVNNVLAGADAGLLSSNADIPSSEAPENHIGDLSDAQSDARDRAVAERLMGNGRVSDFVPVESAERNSNDSSNDGISSDRVADTAVAGVAGAAVGAAMARPGESKGYDDIIAANNIDDGTDNKSNDDIGTTNINDADRVTNEINMGDGSSTDIGDGERNELAKNTAKDLASSASSLVANSSGKSDTESNDLTAEDKNKLEKATDNATESSLNGLAQGRKAAERAKGAALTEDEARAANIGAVVAQTNDDNMVHKAAVAGANAVSQSPMTDEEVDKLTSGIQARNSTEAIEKKAVKSAAEKAISKEVGRSQLSEDEKAMAQKATDKAISEGKAKADVHNIAQSAAAVGACSIASDSYHGNKETQARVKAAADKVVDTAEKSTSTQSLAASQALQAARAANGGQLSEEQKKAVIAASNQTVADIERAALKSAEVANGGSPLTEAQKADVKKAVSNNAIQASAVNAANSVLSATGKSKLSKASEAAVRARAVEQANEVRADNTPEQIAAKACVAGANEMVGYGGMTEAQKAIVSDACKAESNHATEAIQGSSVDSMAGNAAVMAVQSSRKANSKAPLSQENVHATYKAGQAQANRVMRANNTARVAANVGSQSAMAVHKTGNSKPGMSTSRVKTAGSIAGIASNSSIIGTGASVVSSEYAEYGKQQDIINQAQANGQFSNQSQNVGSTNTNTSSGQRETVITRTGSTSAMDIDGTGSGMSNAGPNHVVVNVQINNGVNNGNRIPTSISANGMSSYISRAQTAAQTMMKSTDKSVRNAGSIAMKNQSMMQDAVTPPASGRDTIRMAQSMVNQAANTRKQATVLLRAGHTQAGAALMEQATVLENRANTLSPGTQMRMEASKYARNVGRYTFLAGSKNGIVSAIGQAGLAHSHHQFWAGVENAKHEQMLNNMGFGGNVAMKTSVNSGMSGGTTVTYDNQDMTEAEARWRGIDAESVNARQKDEILKARREAQQKAKNAASKFGRELKEAKANRDKMAKDLNNLKSSHRTKKLDEPSWYKSGEHASSYTGFDRKSNDNGTLDDK